MTSEEIISPPASPKLHPVLVLESGTKIGDYTLIEKLGSGEFAKVFSAKKDDKIYAIKIQRDNIIAKESAEDEINSLKKIKELGGHPNIIECIDTFDYNGLKCLVLPKLGSNLVDLLYKKYPSGITFSIVKRIMLQTFSALEFMHKHGMVHSDIKPDNIMLTKNYSEINGPDDVEIIVADFGTTLDNVKDYFSDHIQTPEYQAPEVIIGGTLESGIDIWSAFCMFYELLTSDYLFNINDHSHESDDENDGESYSYYTDSDDDAAAATENVAVGGAVSENADDETVSFIDSESDSSDKEERMLNLIHLYQMYELLGGIPAHILDAGEYTHRYYINNKLRGALRVPFGQLTTFISTKLQGREISNSDRSNIAQLFRQGLDYDTNHRINATDAIKNLEKIGNGNVNGNKNNQTGKGKNKKA